MGNSRSTNVVPKYEMNHLSADVKLTGMKDYRRVATAGNIFDQQQDVNRSQDIGYGMKNALQFASTLVRIFGDLRVVVG
ncbi:hypothetical protein K443DRAFT_140691 [Laccaria amethystina LaAM-08-1]|jgi:hypothetical protein|uniref:Uncharacterized protein n=1 Tax=Laccaria amethystina LaAM-08-1 TaxID=1095629 RepID=A0A0C9YQ22_9AGAR|nr:hypothetical protein K443DRAFT_140691 [Laccaria amethystina LaAM-08-1]